MSQAYAKVTELDIKFIVNVLAFNENPIKVTKWAQIAEVMNLKNASTASVRFGQIMRKLKAIAGGDTSPTKAKVTKRKLDDTSIRIAKKAKKLIDDEHSDKEHDDEGPSDDEEEAPVAKKRENNIDKKLDVKAEGVDWLQDVSDQELLGEMP